MSAMPSQAELRPTTPRQYQPNQVEGANKAGARPHQLFYWSVAVRAAFPATADGRDLPDEGRQDERERKPAWPRACGR